MIKTTWFKLKSNINSRPEEIKFIDNTTFYTISAKIGDETLNAEIIKTNPRNKAQIDFEDNFKAKANSKDLSAFPTLDHRVDSSISNRTISGFALPGTLTSDSSWFIYADDVVGDSTVRQFAQINNVPVVGFSHSWDNRTNLFPEAPAATSTTSTDFDGINDYCNGGDIHQYDAADAFTINLWIKPQNTAAQRALFSKTTNDISVFGYVLYHNSSGQLFLQMRASGTNRQYTFTSSTLTPNIWQMVTLTYDGSQNINGARVYINSLVGATPSSGGLNGWLTGQDFTLGSRNAGFEFSGRIDQVTIFDKALDSSEIIELYNSGELFNPTTHSANANLQSWYRMGDDDTFPIISDNVGSDDLTMTNMTSDDFVEDAP